MEGVVWLRHYNPSLIPLRGPLGIPVSPSLKVALGSVTLVGRPKSRMVQGNPGFFHVPRESRSPVAAEGDIAVDK